ncbi:2-dehydro-3-deoxy-6-phosphogalactonate aldolase [Salinisphaera hydrothermalis]|uniref:2-dehydro-3-deoxy-6-phosphogalactonate aldolase n=1 Tax=Salinisphaera hydrothermalis (strain C41B8) TaxID=1304275 RepID=A0A084IH95_SALHC|nr:2-dehydro-3-deoxy-6-phosphogalactonate aldolase [Salinisphaera hydrothermalis]KEZ76079.1 2-dehydro-3-deoxy-6-phosphogalactonate aldolase [Salinisphaera hydrothermalis C41B8]
MLNDYLKDLPLIAILRGVKPDEIEAVGDALFEAGFRVIEIPLNSPDPLASIEKLSAKLGDAALVGAGTVLQPEQVGQVADAGGRIIVSPNAKASVIEATVRAGLASAPGVATPTEGFAALDAGAHALKLFPAEAMGPKVVKAWRAVVPPDVPLMPVGGINPDNMAEFVAAGATGFGLGSALYKAGMDADTVAENARAFASAWQHVAAQS